MYQKRWPTCQGLRIAMDTGFRNLVLESDCLKLISHMRKGAVENSSFGNIVRDILLLGRNCASLSFCYVCRDGNI